MFILYGCNSGAPKRGKKGLKIFVVVVVALFVKCRSETFNVYRFPLEGAPG